MDSDKIQEIVKTLEDMNSTLNAEQIMNVIIEIVNINNLLVDFKKNVKLINSKLKLIKNILNNLYTISLTNYESIIKIIDLIKLKNSIQGSTIAIKQTENFTFVQKRNGNNIVKFQSGDKYEGNLNGNKYEGKGKYIYKSGDIYEGEYKDNKKEGKGVYYFKEGDKYDGEFKDDKIEGRGTYYYNDENFDGLRYEGEWKNDKKEGKGIYYLKNGDRYEGDFINDNFEGRGIYYYANGDRYEGEFKNDEFEGKGIFYYFDGLRQMGDYAQGKPIGKHVKMDINGEIETIVFK